MSTYKELYDFLGNFDVNMNVAEPLLNKLIYESPQIKKINDYLYEMYCDKLDYSGTQRFLNESALPIGACSSYYKNGLYGRNYDWYYDNNVSFIIHVPATDNRHASVGVTNAIRMNYITKEFMENGKYNEMIDYLPCMMLDGINDAGVVCNINVLPSKDHDRTSGTDKTKEPFCILMAVRLILDNADSADAAIRLLSEKNIYCPSVKMFSNEIHLMVADSEKSYCVEFIGNEMKVIDFAEQGINPVMTNFYLYGFDGNTSTAYYKKDTYDEDTTTLTQHAAGLERYDILNAEFEKNDADYNIEDVKSAMESVWYTKCYDDSKEPIWYSELSDKYSNTLDLTIDSDVSEYYPIFNIMKELYEKRDRNTGKTWQTVHTAIYDIANLKMYLTTQEDGEYIELNI